MGASVDRRVQRALQTLRECGVEAPIVLQERPFFGTYPAKFDEKGRFQVPADFRRTLLYRQGLDEGEKARVVVSAWDDDYGYIGVTDRYPRSPSHQDYRHLYEATVDGQGRLGVPVTTLRSIDMDQERVQIIGTGDSFLVVKEELADSSLDKITELYAGHQSALSH